MEMTKYFSHEALAMMVAAEGQTIEMVVCHLWLNNIDKNSPLEIIDNIQLRFKDSKSLTIGCNPDGDALDAYKFDFKATAAQLKEEFGDSIRMFAVNASGTKMWEGVIGLKLKGVRVEKEGDGHKANSLVLDFGEEKRLVAISPMDGLLLDYYEE